MERPSPAVRISELPSEASRLLGEFEGEASDLGLEWARARVESSRTRLREDWLLGALWIGPKDEAVGLITWREIPQVGRAIELIHLSEGYRSTNALSKVLDLVGSAAHGSPLFSSPDTLLGLDWSAQASPWGSRGFHYFSRTALSRSTSIPVLVRPELAAGRLRPLARSDEEGLLRLLASSYHGHVDRIHAMHGDELEDARLNLSDIFSGRYGPLLLAASWVIEEQGHLLGASLITDHGPVPLLADLAVDPANRRQGLGELLVESSLESLRELRFTELTLTVTLQNFGATSLYRKLGFVPVDAAEEGLWARPDLVGVAWPPKAPLSDPSDAA